MKFSNLNCFIEIFSSQASNAAELADMSVQSSRLVLETSPLHGIPFAVKDIFRFDGRQPSGGSRFNNLCETTISSPLISDFVQAGAIVMGVTNLDELCYGMTGFNTHFGTVRNPIDESRIVGGSSSGSAAAVAAGIVPFALGSDTGGSIRVPAACCGIVGFKPSHGLFSLDGAIPLSPTQDCVGWLTPSVADALFIFRVARELRQEKLINLCATQSLEGVTFGVFDHSFFSLKEVDFKEDFRQAVDLIRHMGATVKTVDGSFLEIFDRSAATITGFEAASLYRQRAEFNSTLFSASTLERIRRGQTIGQDEYDRAMVLKTNHVINSPLEVLGCDFFLAPTIVRSPPTIEEIAKDSHAELAHTLESLRATRAFNFHGGPILSIPLKSGLRFPTSLQIVGARFDDVRLLTAGELISSAWLDRP